jgi:hypothetical protein
MKLSKTIKNLRETKESFFNLESKVFLTHDLLKKRLLFNSTIWNNLTHSFNTKDSTNFKILKREINGISKEYYLLKRKDFSDKIPF